VAKPNQEGKIYSRKTTLTRNNHLRVGIEKEVTIVYKILSAKVEAQTKRKR